MARNNNGSTSNRLTSASSHFATNGDTCTMSIWVKLNSKAATRNFCGYFREAVGGNGGMYLAYGSVANSIAAVTYTAGVFHNANIIPAPAVNIWFHVCGVFEGLSKRTSYLNGTTSVTSTATSASAPMGMYSVGVTRDRQVGWYDPMNGSLAENGVWDVALTSDEIIALSKGISPLFIRPESLVSYYPLQNKTGGEKDIVGGYNLTQAGTVLYADHAPIRYPSAQIIQFPTTGAPFLGGGSAGRARFM